MWRSLIPLFLALPLSAASLPEVRVTADDTVITRSCRIVIPPGTVLSDANTNGVIQIAADNITIEFTPGCVLRGAPETADGDTLRGIGIRVQGRKGVTLKGAHVHGFFNGLVATDCDGLVLDGGDFSGNYRQRLRSTPQAEDGADWLFPHNNDQQKWRDQYGGAVCVENASRVVLRNLTIRRGQNGLILDRVNDSQVYDNDASFLSGWGLALWRSSRNIITRNAFDFCVRGHSEGIYNRGQDSAGILAFEQCNENTIAENSATHGGDCFFGFAGREALGEVWMEEQRTRLRRETGKQDVDALIEIPEELARKFSALGCNRNLLIGNDFSYSPAHGIEMTFSEGNVFARNRLVENAICGVWGGYSSDTLIAQNEFTGNGGLAYGLERGAINMEHGSNNRIVRNTFLNNKAAIHLWWDNDGGLFKLPGVAGNLRGISGNVIAGNSFQLDEHHPFQPLNERDRLILLQLRDDGTHHIRDNAWFDNRVSISITNGVEFAVKPGAEPSTNGSLPKFAVPSYKVLGNKHPVGARKHLRGRKNILLDEWGPWDHSGPFVRAVGSDRGAPAWEVFNVPNFAAQLAAPFATLSRERGSVPQSEIVRIHANAGLTSYQLALRGRGLDRVLSGKILKTPWDVTFFSWRNGPDPRTNLVDWRALASKPEAVSVQLDSLNFAYGGRGPRDLKLSDEVTRRGPGGERFGMIARTSLPLTEGKWRIITSSDDGVRIQINGKVVLENWNWHGPERNEATFDHPSATTPTEIVVEHFEIDGHSELKLDLEPVR